MVIWFLHNIALGSQARMGWLGVDVIGSIRSTDVVGKLCLFVLAVFSIVSWAVIVYKWFQIHNASRQCQGFLNECADGTGTLDDAYKTTAKYPDSPPAKLLREAYIEARIENWFEAKHYTSLTERLTVARISIERVVEQTVSSEIRLLEKYLIYLATTASVCPFIGLFGTVWGVLGAFQSLAHQGSAAIQTLAPGISTALTTTVAGLVAAIPAALFYNYLVNKNQHLLAEMDAFGLEINSIIQKHIIKNS